MVTRKRRSLVRGGFTLMELLVVVAILVVLAGAGGVIYMRFQEDEDKKTALAQTKLIADAVKMYQAANGEYPASLQALAEGTKPYLEASALRDPWGNEYVYQNPGQAHQTGAPDIYSLGPNASDPNGKIGDWMTKPP